MVSQRRRERLERKLRRKEEIGIRYKEMEDLTFREGLDHNDIFCGWLRQPIRVKEKIVSGYCARYEKNCWYQYPIQGCVK